VWDDGYCKSADGVERMFDKLTCDASPTTLSHPASGHSPHGHSTASERGSSLRTTTHIAIVLVGHIREDLIL
jgi:hypothetical protein